MGKINFLAFSAVLIALNSCAPVKRMDANAEQTARDIHERLSDAIARDGFSHRIISERNPNLHIDSIHLRIPLDGVRRRHEGVQRVLESIARVCALPEYASLPIRIIVSTEDEVDGGFLRSVMERELAAHVNVSFDVRGGGADGVVIAVSHPSVSVRP